MVSVAGCWDGSSDKASNSNDQVVIRLRCQNNDPVGTWKFFKNDWANTLLPAPSCMHGSFVRVCPLSGGAPAAAGTLRVKAAKLG